MARIAQITFEQRVARIEQKVAIRPGAYPTGNLLRPSQKVRRVYWEMLVVGAMAGGILGKLFAMQVGILFVAELDAAALYEFAMTDYLRAALLLSVAIAPLGFLMSQVFARSNPRSWQFWIGYFAAVLGANATDIQTYIELAT